MSDKGRKLPEKHRPTKGGHCVRLGQGKVRPWIASASTPLTSTEHALACHPATPCPELAGIRVAVGRDADGALLLRYTLAGDLAGLRLPSPQPAGPADNLWQHTCCEAFVALAGDAYREFNFSPSGQWAVYDFSGYRERCAAPPPSAAPTIAVATDPAGLALTARIPAARLPTMETPLGLTAVIETRTGGKSYWALAHPAPQPDFHRREAFIATLALP